MLPTPIPKPYGPDVSGRLRAGVTRKPGYDAASYKRDYPWNFLGGPVPPTAAAIARGWWNKPLRPPRQLSQQERDDFAKVRDFLLGLAGNDCVFCANGVDEVPHGMLLRDGELYYGGHAGMDVLKATTRPMLQNGYFEELMEENPFLQAFHGYVLTIYGEWGIPVTPIPVLDTGNGILFVRNHMHDVAFFGTIRPYRPEPADGRSGKAKRNRNDRRRTE